MKITYIHHSAFAVETEAVCLLFDYYQGDLPDFPAEKPLYVFASHRHPDHFSEKIFELAKGREKIRFLLSADIWKKRVPGELMEKTAFLEPYETYADDFLKAETYLSTDEGVAFWVHTDGPEIYHAGDLNHWYWEGEDEAWNTSMTKQYRAELGKMAGRTADAAFLPLDPRLGKYFYLGIDDFMKDVDAKAIFPMHFWGEYDVCSRLKALPVSAPYRDRIAEITGEGQTFILA